MYTIYDNAYDTPPIHNSPVTHICDDPDAIHGNLNPTASLPASAISQDEFDKVS